MKDVLFDPQPDIALDRLWDDNDIIADSVENVIDWVRSGDARARRRSFSGGVLLIEVRAAGQDWSVLWEDAEDGSATIRHIAETTSI